MSIIQESVNHVYVYMLSQIFLNCKLESELQTQIECLIFFQTQCLNQLFQLQNPKDFFYSIISNNYDLTMF